MRTDPLEAKDRNAQDQGQKAQVQLLLKKRSSKKIFSRIPKEKNKKGLRKFFAKFLAFSYIMLKMNKSNAHQTIWGSSNVNPRGVDLLAYCVSADLNFCNVDNKQHSELKRVKRF